MNSDEYDVTCGIDWLSFTYPDGTYQRPFYLSKQHWDDRAALMNYTVVRKFHSGVIEARNPDRPAMGIHVVYSADALSKIALDYQITPLSIMTNSMGNGAKCRRVDLKIDVKGCGLDINELAQHVDEKKCATNTRRATYIQGKLDAKDHGLYIGSLKKRTRLMRIYDKAVELNLDDYVDWKRIELEHKGDYATKASESIKGAENPANRIVELIKTFADFPASRAWVMATGGDYHRMGVPDKKDGKTWLWLTNTVVKTLAREILAEPSRYEIFYHLLNDELIRQTEENEK